jgi:hypothetical protein
VFAARIRVEMGGAALPFDEVVDSALEALDTIAKHPAPDPRP